MYKLQPTVLVGGDSGGETCFLAEVPRESVIRTPCAGHIPKMKVEIRTPLSQKPLTQRNSQSHQS